MCNVHIYANAVHFKWNNLIRLIANSESRSVNGTWKWKTIRSKFFLCLNQKSTFWIALNDKIRQICFSNAAYKGCTNGRKIRCDIFINVLLSIFYSQNRFSLANDMWQALSDSLSSSYAFTLNHISVLVVSSVLITSHWLRSDMWGEIDCRHTHTHWECVCVWEREGCLIDRPMGRTEKPFTRFSIDVENKHVNTMCPNTWCMRAPNSLTCFY